MKKVVIIVGAVIAAAGLAFGGYKIAKATKNKKNAPANEPEQAKENTPAAPAAEAPKEEPAPAPEQAKEEK